MVLMTLCPLAHAAEEAGMKVPTDPDNGYPGLEFPHFTVFAIMQIGREFASADDLIHNAKIIAGIPDERIKQISYGEVLKMGYI